MAHQSHTLAALAAEHGWHTEVKQASGHRDSNDRIVMEPWTRAMEFFRGSESVRVDFSTSGNVLKVQTRHGFTGDLLTYEWQPGGRPYLVRAKIIREILASNLKDFRKQSGYNFTLNHR